MKNPRDLTAREIFNEAIKKIARSRVSPSELKIKGVDVVDLLDAALRDNPDDPDLNRLRGEIYFQDMKYNQAIAHFTKALEFQPNDNENTYNLAAAFFQTAQYERAQALFEAISAFPHDYDLTFMSAYSLFKTGQRHRASELLNDIKENIPDLMTSFRNELSEMLLAYSENSRTPDP